MELIKPGRGNYVEPAVSLFEAAEAAVRSWCSRLKASAQTD